MVRGKQNRLRYSLSNATELVKNFSVKNAIWVRFEILQSSSHPNAILDIAGMNEDINLGLAGGGIPETQEVYEYGDKAGNVIFDFDCTLTHGFNPLGGNEVIILIDFTTIEQ